MARRRVGVSGGAEPPHRLRREDAHGPVLVRRQDLSYGLRSTGIALPADGCERDALHGLVRVVRRGDHGGGRGVRLRARQEDDRLRADGRVWMPGQCDDARLERPRDVPRSLVRGGRLRTVAPGAEGCGADERLERAITGRQRVEHGARALAGRLERGEGGALDRARVRDERGRPLGVAEPAGHELGQGRLDVERPVGDGERILDGVRVPPSCRVPRREQGERPAPRVPHRLGRQPRARALRVARGERCVRHGGDGRPSPGRRPTSGAHSRERHEGHLARKCVAALGEREQVGRLRVRPELSQRIGGGRARHVAGIHPLHDDRDLGHGRALVREREAEDGERLHLGRPAPEQRPQAGHRAPVPRPGGAHPRHAPRCRDRDGVGGHDVALLLARLGREERLVLRQERRVAEATARDHRANTQ